MTAMAMLALAACATAPAAAPGGETATATAGLGGAARLGGVTVRPLAILEDSRCPRDVTCIWAGRLRLRAAVSGVPGTSELVLGERFALPGGGAIAFVAATERAILGAGARPGPPRFTFRREAE